MCYPVALAAPRLPGSKENAVNLLRRVVMAALFNKAVYEEVEHDESLGKQALAVVVLAGLANGVGLAVADYRGVGAWTQGALLKIVFGVGFALFVYFVWAGVTFYVGTGFFGGRATPGELRRTLGYASFPQALGLMAPVWGPWAWVYGLIWSVATGLVAVRQALDISYLKTFIVVVLAAAFAVFIAAFIFVYMGFNALPFLIEGR